MKARYWPCLGVKVGLGPARAFDSSVDLTASNPDMRRDECTRYRVELTQHER